MSSLHPSIEEAFQQIDAGCFSGDSFHDPESRGRLQYFINRWQKHIDELAAEQTAAQNHLIDRQTIEWGTYGKNGDQPLQRKRIAELTTDHIEAILETQDHISVYLRKVFELELQFREFNENVEDFLDSREGWNNG